MKLALLSFDFGKNPPPPQPVPIIIPGEDVEFSGSLTVENISTGQLNFFKPIDTGNFLTGDFEDADDLIIGISSQLAADTFHRANSNPIGGNWTPLGTTGDFGTAQIINNAVYPSSTATADSAYTGVVWPNDQYSQITIGNLIQSFIGVGLRMNPATTSEYALYVFNQSVPAGTYDWAISVVVGGIENVLSFGSINSPLSAGDIILGQIQGSSLSLYHNGFLLGTAVDGTLTSGSAGFVLSSDNTVTDAGGSSWLGGSGSPTPFVLNWIAQGLFLKNIDPTNSVNVSWIPYGGINTSVLTLQPQGVIGFLGKNSVITQLSLSASAPTQVSYVIVGGGDGGTQPPVILIISKTHTGNFTQGQTGATYTIVVSNTGSRPTDGSIVTVTETPSSGLTFVSMSGTGWSVTGQQAIRNDVLNPGNSYPPITVTVNVASNAISPQCNMATVSGGGLVSSVSVTDCATIVSNSVVVLAFVGGAPIDGTLGAIISNNFYMCGGVIGSPFSVNQLFWLNSPTRPPNIPANPNGNLIAPSGTYNPTFSFAGQPSFYNSAVGLMASFYVTGASPSPNTAAFTTNSSLSSPTVVSLNGFTENIPAGSLMTAVVWAFSTTTQATTASITDANGNTWIPLGPAVTWTTLGYHRFVQFFYAVSNALINTAFNVTATVSPASVFIQVSVGPWNQIGTLASATSATLVNNGSTSVPLTITI